jgi:hypothetical protein
VKEAARGVAEHPLVSKSELTKDDQHSKLELDVFVPVWLRQLWKEYSELDLPEVPTSPLPVLMLVLYMKHAFPLVLQKISVQVQSDKCVQYNVQLREKF